MPLTDRNVMLAKIAFENIQNTALCASLAVAATIVARYPEASPLGIRGAVGISAVLYLTSFVLLCWNMILGIDGIRKLLPPGRFWQWALFMLLVCLVVFSEFAVMGAVMKDALVKLR